MIAVDLYVVLRVVLSQLYDKVFHTGEHVAVQSTRSVTPNPLQLASIRRLTVSFNITITFTISTPNDYHRVSRMAHISGVRYLLTICVGTSTVLSYCAFRDGRFILDLSIGIECSRVLSRCLAHQIWVIRHECFPRPSIL